MANTINQDDLDQNNQNQQPNNQQNQNQPNTIQTYQPPKQNKQGSGYTNIQRIVGANQQNRLGQAIGQGVQQNIGSLQNRLGQAQNQFQQQTQQNRFDTDQNRQNVQQTLADPTQANQQQQNQFGRLISGQYAGPQQLQNADQLQAQSGDIADIGLSTGTAGGRQGLLQRFVASPQQYTAGQQNLDNLILGQTGARDLAAARQAALAQRGQVNTQLSGAQSVGQEMANRARGFGQDVSQQLGQNVSGINQGLTDQALAAQTARDEQLKGLRDNLGQGKLNQDMAQQLGLTSGAQTFNLDPRQFVQESALRANAQNVATPEQFARMNALRQLSGGYAGQDAQGILNQYAGQEGQAGQFQADKGYNVDADRFKQQYGASQNIYNQRRQETEAPLAKAQQIMAIYDKYINSGKKGWGNAAMDEVRRIAPGAVGGSDTQNLQWARNNLAATQNAHQDRMNQLGQEFGTNTFNVEE